MSDDTTTYRADFATTAGIETMRERFITAATTALGLDDAVLGATVIDDDPQLQRQNRSRATVKIQARGVVLVLRTIVENPDLFAEPNDPPASGGLFEIEVTAAGHVGIVPTAEKAITGLLDALEGVRPVAFPNGHGIGIWTEPGEDRYVFADARSRDGV